ncbi:hypothetical protein [Streptomyces sp. NPDC057910]
MGDRNRLVLGEAKEVLRAEGREGFSREVCAMPLAWLVSRAASVSASS